MRSRYLLEINSLEDLEDLIEVNFLALNTMPPEEQAVGLRSSLASHRGQLLQRLGRHEEGLMWLKKSYTIRSHDKPFNPRESAFAADNAATGIATTNDFPEALKWYERARDHYLEWSNKQDSRRGELTPTVMINLGACLLYCGQIKQGRELLDKALAQVESTQPYNWARAAG